jgi:tetratricopeptide (TPR) repeat protein
VRMRWVTLLICLLYATAQAQPGDWGVRRDPFDPTVIQRHKAILAREPHDVGSLQALIALYKRFRSVATLESEYRALPTEWASLVVIARLPRTDRTATTALWKQALAVNPQDARGWLALGELTVDALAARTAFRNAVEHAKSPRDKKLALTKLIGAARSAADPTTADAAYVELIAMTPKDGQLWLDRGNSQLSAGWYVPALETFAKAEALLGADPERRLTAAINRGVALERVARVDDAMELWERTLDRTPRGSYLRREIVGRIIEAERKRKQLGTAVARLEKRWPERTRGFYEWDMLGDLFVEVADDERALAAYRKAIAKAPTEIETQRKLIKLLDKLYPSHALAQHEAAAKLAPGDANLQIELAKRYRLSDPDKAMATLDRLTRRMAKSIGVRVALAELYGQWDEQARQTIEYEAIAELEPDDPDHAVVLGNAWWRGGNRSKAIEAWKRLSKINTAATQLRLGEILSLHSLFSDAAVAFTSSLALDATNSEAWRGRARAHDALGKYGDAISDAKRAVALIGTTTAKDGLPVRFQLVRSLGKQYRGHDNLETELRRWRFAFARGDNAAGYLLVAHHARIQSHQHHDALLSLYRRVPTDDALGISLARSMASRKEFAAARTELERIARRSPDKAEEIQHLISQVESDRARALEERLREEEGIDPRPNPMPPLIPRRGKLGVRFGVGADVAGTSSALLDFGIVRTTRLTRKQKNTGLALRLDYTQRDDRGDVVKAIGFGGAVQTRVVAARRFELVAGAGARFEARFSRDAMTSPYGGPALAADLSVELLPRNMPATIGVRLQQAVTDPVKSSAVLFELGFEVR